MLSGRGNQTFALALGLSLALHVVLLLAAPNPAGWGGPPERRSVVAVRLTSPTIAPPASQPEEPEPEKTREVELGLDAPNPPSRTWLGFREYLKQLAAKSEIEQAAFTDAPVAAAPAAPPSPPAPAPQPATPALAQATPQPTDSTEPKESDAPPQPQPAAAQSPTEPARAIEQPEQNNDAPKAETDAAPEEKSDSTNESEPAPALDGIAIATSDANADAPAIEEPTGSFLAPLTALIEQAREAAKQAAAMSQQPPPPTAAAQPRPMIARQPTQGDPSLGAQSDRESDPSSVIDVPREQWQLGKPLAAQGLEIKPKRPEMTILTTLTAWPRNPVCRVSFDRDGVPVKAVLVQATGDSRVDAAIEASLYRWRASGKELESLKGDQTVDLTIRLLINPKRRSEDKDEDEPAG